MKQATLKKSVKITGTGLHKGAPVAVIFRPARENTGIVFKNKGETYKLDVKLVAETKRGTVIKRGGSVIHTVEHMLSAVKSFGIDNVTVDLRGDEAPALDGSARGFITAFKKTGLMAQNAERKAFTLKDTFLAGGNGRYIAAIPGRGFTVMYFSDFSGMGIRPEEACLEVNPERYCREIAGARTFGFKSEIYALKKGGLIKGASLKNSILIDKGRPVNGRLRWKNELARHKVLDITGDFAFIEGDINMTVIAYKTGHAENIKMVSMLLNKV